MTETRAPRMAARPAAPLTVAQQRAGMFPKAVEATLEVKYADGSVTRVEFQPPPEGTLDVEFTSSDLPGTAALPAVPSTVLRPTDLDRQQYRLDVGGAELVHVEQLVRRRAH